jgi:CBS domain-containing protein
MVFIKRRRKIPLRAEDIMITELVTINPEATIAEAAKLMWERRVGSVLVVAADGKLRGIVTERDMVFACSEGWDPTKRLVMDIMTEDPITVRRDDDVLTVIRKMREVGVRHLPVVDEEGRPVGIISYRDVLDLIMTIFGVTLGIYAED